MNKSPKTVRFNNISNTIYQIQYIKYNISNTIYQIQYIKYNISNDKYRK